MIIDLILNRKDGQTYDVNSFADMASKYADTFADYRIINALGMGTEKDIKKVLCNYIKRNNYNNNLCNYINQQNWL